MPLRTRRVIPAALEKGFTLPELMIVIVLMGILAAIAIPSWFGLVESRQVESAANQIASDIRLSHSSATNRLQNETFRVSSSTPARSYEVGAAGDLRGRLLSEGGGPRFPPSSAGTTLYVCSKGTIQAVGCSNYTASAYHNLSVVSRTGRLTYVVRINAQTSNVRVCRETC